jgi:hypothetical protein
MKDALELEFLDRMKRVLVFIADGTSFTMVLLRVNYLKVKPLCNFIHSVVILKILTVILKIRV